MRIADARTRLSSLGVKIRERLRRLRSSPPAVPPTAISHNGIVLQPGMRIRLPGGEGTHTVHRVIGHDLIQVKYSDGVVDSAPSKQWNAVRAKRRR